MATTSKVIIQTKIQKNDMNIRSIKTFVGAEYEIKKWTKESGREERKETKRYGQNKWLQK